MMAEGIVASATTGSASSIIDDIVAYEREYESWEKRGDNIISRYRDESRMSTTNAEVLNRTFNILWANTEVLAPTLYSRLPRVEVERRFKDRDPVGRNASLIAERVGTYTLETTSTNDVLKAAVQDLLLPGRATAWVSYEAVMGDETVIDPMTGQPAIDENGEPITQPKKISEKIEPIYVHWKDFGHQAKRTWAENQKVWRRIYMTREKLVERFGAEVGAAIDLDREPLDKANGIDEVKSQATIYEVWCKESKKVYWVHKSNPNVLDEIDPPLDLEGFWPCPRPLWSVMTNNTLIPVPLFVLYQDQASELDKLTNRIGRLTDALKMVGVYNSSVPELQRLLQPNGVADNTLVPVENWAGLSEKGGLKNSIEFVPIAEIAAALLQAFTARDQCKQTIYEITGLSDIIRGSTDPGETLGAQQLKSQYGSIRIRSLQQEVARFSRDIARIVVEIGVEMLEPETIYQMIGGEGIMPPDQFGQALQLLRNDRMRSFHIDIETDSTVALDDSQDKQSAQEFITAMGQFLQQSGPMVQMSPALAPVVGESMMFLVRRFRAGRTMESTIDEAMQKIIEQASQPPQPPPPDPSVIIAQERTKQEELKLQFQASEKEKDRQLEVQRFQAELGLKQGGLQNDTRRVDLDEWKAGHEVKQGYAGIEQAEKLEDRRMMHDLNKLDRSQQFEHEGREIARQDRSEDRAGKVQDKSSEAIGKGLEAIARVMETSGKPKAMRVETGPQGKRYVQEIIN